MRIHSMISITQLKLALNRFKNPYSRIFIQSIPSIKKTQKIDSNFTFKYKFYKIERLLKRRDIKKSIKYLIK